MFLSYKWGMELSRFIEEKEMPESKDRDECLTNKKLDTVIFLIHSNRRCGISYSSKTDSVLIHCQKPFSNSFETKIFAVPGCSS